MLREVLVTLAAVLLTAGYLLALAWLTTWALGADDDAAAATTAVRERDDGMGHRWTCADRA